MRAYFIRITRPGTDEVLKEYTSFNTDGSTNGAALRVELDVPIYTYGEPAGQAHIKISGVDYGDIQSSSDLNDADITVYGGMAAGLPLANPQQAGILVKGSVWQAYGNWLGHDVSLELFIVARKPDSNLSFTWSQGTSLESAVRQVLKIAYPSATVTGGYDASLVYTEDQPFAYSNLQQFARFVLDTSKTIITSADYRGAQIVQTATGFALFDGTSQPKAKPISYLDLVGNATWLEPGLMQFMCPMRADLIPGDVVTMPVGSNQVQTASGLARARQQTAFQGDFQISRIRHLGDSRQLSAESWVTVVDCYPSVVTA